MRPATYEGITHILRTLDVENCVDRVSAVLDDGELKRQLAAYFADEREVTRTVLGIDIYKYSDFDAEKQRLVPVIFQTIYDEAVDHCVKHEFLFRDAQFKSQFISTGDGGFQILATPIHAIVFAVWLQTFVAAYNAYFNYPKLRHMVGPINLRYAVTHGDLFQLDNNFYGSAIVSNARIMARDALNRFLFDAPAVEWVVDHLGSFESLFVADDIDLRRIASVGHGDVIDPGSLFFRAMRDTQTPFNRIDLQKIGSVTTKGTQFDIYNVQVQVLSIRPSTQKGIVITLGNLNTEGIVA